MTEQLIETRRPFTQGDSLEVCLQTAEAFAATDAPIDAIHTQWLRLAVADIRAGKVVTPTDILRFQSMGTTEV